MPIVSKHVSVRIGNRNKAHYKELGYEIEDTIRVKIEDLTPGSHAKVLVQCPVCKKTRYTTLNNYRSNGTCAHCHGKFGKDNPQYTHGNTPKIEKIRKSPKYAQWRLAVYERDNFTCQCCGKQSKLNAHHIQNLASILNTKRIYDTENGITLCEECHTQLHKTIGNNNRCTTAQTIKFIKDYNK